MDMQPAFFKGWAKPGPVRPQEVPCGLIDDSRETVDFISGYYRIVQLKDGHRFSTDDVLTAWYGTSHVPSARSVLDLGSGIGSVGMIAAWRLQGAQFVTVEAQDISVACARKSAVINGLVGRYDIRQGDLRDPCVLADHEKFDLVLGSPPYFAADTGALAEHPQKQACRFEMRGTVADYCATAAKHLENGGYFACCFPIRPQFQEEKVILGSRAAGLTIVRWRPVVFKEGEPALLGLYCMVRSVDIPEDLRDRILWEEPALVIRTADNRIHPEYQSIKMSFGFHP
eukprot:ANDGO_01590.mRNA.1 tRNA1(Val) (adenine(37)-N6)-methyltransferase